MSLTTGSHIDRLPLDVFGFLLTYLDHPSLFRLVTINKTVHALFNNVDLEREERQKKEQDDNGQHFSSQNDEKRGRRTTQNYFLRDYYSTHCSVNSVHHADFFFNFWRAIQAHFLFSKLIGLWSFDVGRVEKADYRLGKTSDYGSRESDARERGAILQIGFDNSLQFDGIGGGHLRVQLYQVAQEEGGFPGLRRAIGLRPTETFSIPFYDDDESINLRNYWRLRHFSSIMPFMRKHAEELENDADVKGRGKVPLINAEHHLVDHRNKSAKVFAIRARREEEKQVRSIMIAEEVAATVDPMFICYQGRYNQSATVQAFVDDEDLLDHSPILCLTSRSESEAVEEEGKSRLLWGGLGGVSKEKENLRVSTFIKPTIELPAGILLKETHAHGESNYGEGPAVSFPELPAGILLKETHAHGESNYGEGPGVFIGK